MFEPLAKLRCRKLGDLSGGQQKMVEVGRALMSRPRVLLLDEPTAGLAPAVGTALLALFRRLATELGIAVLLVEQNVVMALEVADGVMTLVSGAKDLEAPADEVRRRLTEIVEGWLWSERSDEGVGA
jgi:branched-chain amino acid transport system ATP-binding protein